MNEKTAAVIIIGDEILSGRTQDTNTQFIAKELSDIGVKLAEVRVIPDVKSTIISVVNELRSKYDYIFTTGGIGPTHDDITTESIAEAFNVGLVLHQQSFEEMSQRCIDRGVEMNEGTKKMAYLPEGSNPIKNNVSAAPGFQIQNIFVFAGIPNIMQDMFTNIKPQLQASGRYYSKSVLVIIGESLLAPILNDLQKEYNTLSVGSYPSQDSQNNWRVNVVMRGRDEQQVNNAKNSLCSELDAKKIEFSSED